MPGPDLHFIHHDHENHTPPGQKNPGEPLLLYSPTEKESELPSLRVDKNRNDLYANHFFRYMFVSEKNI